MWGFRMKQSTIVLMIFFTIFTFMKSNALAYTVTTNRPRIWLTSSEVAALQDRCTTGGTYDNAVTNYNRIKSWVDSHISDSISGIPLSANYREGDNTANNMSIHLLRTALVYVVSGQASYGERVADLLNWLANNGSGLWSRSASTSDGAGIVYPALAVAFDWCYDEVVDEGYLSSVVNYFNDIVNSAINTPTCRQGWSPGMDSLYAGYKTEEPWHAGFLAFAIHGESGAGSNVGTLIERMRYYIRDYSGRYDESGFEGAVPIGGTYVYEQLVWHRTAFLELMQSAIEDENYWTSTDTLYADGENDGSDNARYHYRWKVLAARPNAVNPRIGDGFSMSLCGDGRYETAAAYISAKRTQDQIAQYYHDICQIYNSNINRGSWHANRFVQDFLYCLWYDPSLSSSLSTASEANFWKGASMVTFRSGFDFTSSTDIWFMTHPIKKHDYLHWHSDLGALQMARGNDWLLLNAGTYSYGASYSKYHDEMPWSYSTLWINNLVPTVYFNTDSYGGFISDHGEWNSTYSPQAAINDHGNIKRFQSENNNYAYAHMDISDNYPNASLVHRNIVFIDDKWFVIYDNITKSTPSHEVKIAWQVAKEPVATPNDWGSISGCRADVTNSTVWRVNTGASRLWYRILSPTSNITMRQVGGDNCYTTDQNYHDHGGSTTTWRVEVFSTASNTNDRYLHVLQPVASTAPETVNNLLAIIDSNFIGAEIRDPTRCAVLFSKDGSDYNETSFDVSDSSETLKAVVTNLQPGYYEVNQGGNVILSDQLVDSSGMIYFTADLSAGHSFHIYFQANQSIPPNPPSNLRILP